MWGARKRGVEEVRELGDVEVHASMTDEAASLERVRLRLLYKSSRLLDKSSLVNLSGAVYSCSDCVA
jgi:hypothetical protein